MIIRNEGGRLRLINQVDHALAAGRLAGAWGRTPYQPPEPLGAVRLATAIHDAGWQDWELAPRLRPDTQQPHDFISIPSDDHVEIYERSVALALKADRYAGLLVSMHGAGFYRQRYGHMPNLEFKSVLPEFVPLVESFIARQEALQRRLVAELEPDPVTLWTHYRWLQGWDALAVYLGMDNPVTRRTFHLGVMPQYPGGPEEPLCLTGAGEGVYTVNPWPFQPDRLELTMPARYVPDRPYASQADFLEVFAAAVPEPLTLRIVPCA
jgi:hypothetical protein